MISMKRELRRESKKRFRKEFKNEGKELIKPERPGLLKEWKVLCDIYCNNMFGVRILTKATKIMRKLNIERKKSRRVKVKPYKRASEAFIVFFDNKKFGLIQGEYILEIVKKFHKRGEHFARIMRPKLEERYGA